MIYRTMSAILMNINVLQWLHVTVHHVWMEVSVQ